MLYSSFPGVFPPELSQPIVTDLSFGGTQTGGGESVGHEGGGQFINGRIV